MTDLQSTLDAIDAVTTPVCGWCTAPLPTNGPSELFCSAEHQTLWNERCAEVLVGYREPYELGGWAWHDGYQLDTGVAVYRHHATADSAPLVAPGIAGGTDAATLRQIVNELGHAGTLLFDQIVERFAEIGRAIQPFAETLRQSGAIPVELPDDPRVRALEFRRHRNTGPPRRQRAPHTITPRSSR